MPSSKLGQASITVRCTEKELREIHKKAEEHNFKSMAEYVRFVALNAEIKAEVKKESQ
jgi:acetone carboxylase gamma subunit